MKKNYLLHFKTLKIKALFSQITLPKLAFILLCAAIGFSCNIPQSITIIGDPGLYLPLGSPFDLLEEDQRLESYFNRDRIKEMMDKNTDELDLSYPVELYDYRGDLSAYSTPPQTYIAHYPIAKMKLDLPEYLQDMKREYTDPFVDIPDLGLTTPSEFNTIYPNGIFLTPSGGISPIESEPLFTIPLRDMSKLILTVTGTKFGIKVNYNEYFEEHLRIKIPVFKVGDDDPDGYAKGRRNIEDNTLEFYNESFTGFSPPGDLVDTYKLEIYVKLTGMVTGQIAPDLIFDWDTAAIDTSSKENLSGEFNFDRPLSELEEFLGATVTFNEAMMYVYFSTVEELGSNQTMDISIGSGNDKVDVLQDTQLLNKTRPVLTEPYESAIPSDSIKRTPDEPEYIDITDALNTETNMSIKYMIKINESIIKSENVSDLGEGAEISIDIVILLPLDFSVYPGAIESKKDGYVKLDMNGVFTLSDEGEEDEADKDLFFRKGDNDDLFDNIEAIKLVFKRLENTIIDAEIYLYIFTDEYDNLLEFDFDREEIDLLLAKEDMVYPFYPNFELLLKKEDGMNCALLKIKQQEPDVPPAFDFFMAAEAQTDIEYTYNF